MIQRLLLDLFTMRRERMPAWRKRWDAVNLVLLAAVLVFVVWTTFFP